MLSFFFLYPHLYPRFVFATPPGTHDAARMRWGGNPEELNPCSSPQHRLQPAWGPLHLTPLGDVRNSPRVRLELPARETGREYLLRGATLGQVRFQSLIGCSPFTIHRLLSPPTSAKGRLELPAGQPSREYLCRGGALPSVSKRHPAHLQDGAPKG